MTPVGDAVLARIAARVCGVHGSLAPSLGVEVAFAAVEITVAVRDVGTVLSVPGVVVAPANGDVGRRGDEVLAAAVAVVVDLDGGGGGDERADGGEEGEFHCGGWMVFGGGVKVDRVDGWVWEGGGRVYIGLLSGGWIFWTGSLVEIF